MARVVVALLVCVALLLAPVSGVIFKFDVTLPQGHKPEVDHTTMFSPEDSPAAGYPGDGDTVISYNLNFTWQGTGQPNGVVHSVIVPYDYQRGVAPACCTAKDCTEGELSFALPKDADVQGIFHERITFNGTNGLVRMFTEHTLHQSGWYYHYILNCRSSHVPAVHVAGEMVWRNPYGYLPADEFPFLWFYMVMLLVYIVLACGWGALLYINRADIISLQVAITIALSISLIEGSVFYLYYFLYNNTGDFIVIIYLVGILLDCTRITFSALLLLAVARGYLVVNESLGEPKLIAGVLAAAVGYWITIMSTSMVHALIENTTYQIADNTMPTLDVLILLFAFSYYCFVRTFALLTMTIFYISLSSEANLNKLFYSLITTIAKLKAAQEWVKLKLYINLMLILILACILAFLCQLVELVVVWDTPLEAGLYAYGWVWEAYWQLLYLLIICALAVLLRPSPFNRRYAYAQVSMQERPLDQIQKQFTIDSEGEVVPTDDNSIGSPAPRPAEEVPLSPAPTAAPAAAPKVPIESVNSTNEASGPATDSDKQPLTQKTDA